eukprot:5331688-Pleurochrysis_carterae.AAC.1
MITLIGPDAGAALVGIERVAGPVSGAAAGAVVKLKSGRLRVPAALAYSHARSEWRTLHCMWAATAVGRRSTRVA